jgi:hypothetical protein
VDGACLEKADLVCGAVACREANNQFDDEYQGHPR